VVSSQIVSCTPVVGVLIVAVTFLLTGFLKKDKKILFMGVACTGLLLLFGGAAMLALASTEGDSSSKIGALIIGSAIGAGIIVIVLGLVGMARPEAVWPDKPARNPSRQEKLL
jgi:hypothetical protein